MSQFTGKVALVTGGNAGIGRAAAMSLSNRARKSSSADAVKRKAVKSSPRSKPSAVKRSSSKPTCRKRAMSKR